MSRNERYVAAPPSAVFDVLADGWGYASWVVGAARIRDVDPAWPAPGSRIHHSVGAWPLLVDDTSTMDVWERDRLCVLTVRAWPTGEGRVRIRVEPEGEGSRVVMEEEAVSGPARFVPRVLQDASLLPRNREALRRLGFIAERREVQAHG